MEVKPKIDEAWKKVLEDAFSAPYFKSLKSSLIQEYKNHRIYPPKKDIFNAFDLAPFDKVKVVIIGQDPYHGPGQAHGLCFSVQKGTPPPPSLKNILKEIQNDLGYSMPGHGDLTYWAKQGVFLLNTLLTVRESQPLSHKDIGWEKFTDHAISKLSEKGQDLVFLLWGSKARQKKQLINASRHHILESSHPSPLSAHRGFLGCGHFSKTNEILRSRGKSEIDWEIK